MAEIVKSKSQLLLEIIVAIALAVFVTYAPTLVGTTLIPADNQLAPLVPIAVGIVYIAAYEILSVEGYAVFKDMLDKLKGTGIKSDDKGSMSPAAYFLIAILGLVVLAAVVAVYVFHIDLLAALFGVVLLVLGALSSRLYKPAKSWTGVSVIDGRAYINWDQFDKSRVHVQAVPLGLLHIMFTSNGYTWESLKAQFNNEDGYIYSLEIDPTADVVPEDPNGVYLEMGRLPGDEALDYILGKIAGKGFDITQIKAGLCLDAKTLADMKGSNSYFEFLIDGLIDPKDGTPWGITKAWAVHLLRDDYFLRREADDLYWKYYKGG